MCISDMCYKQKVISHFYFYNTVKLVTITQYIFSGFNQVWCLQSSLQNLIIALISLGRIGHLVLKKRHEALRIDYPSCLDRSLSTRVCAPFAFCVRSPFTVRISFNKFRSAVTHRSLCVRSGFVHRSLSVRSPFNWESRTLQGLYSPIRMSLLLV